jgi:hypothetical protein
MPPTPKSIARPATATAIAWPLSKWTRLTSSPSAAK